MPTPDVFKNLGEPVDKMSEMEVLGAKIVFDGFTPGIQSFDLSKPQNEGLKNYLTKDQDFPHNVVIIYDNQMPRLAIVSGRRQILINPGGLPFTPLATGVVNLDYAEILSIQSGQIIFNLNSYIRHPSGRITISKKGSDLSINP